MLKLSVLLRILLTILLVGLPIGIVAFIFSKKVFLRLTRRLSKVDTFDALVRFRNDLTSLYSHKVSRIASGLHTPKPIEEDIPKREPSPSHPTIEDIITSKSSFSKHPDTLVSDDEDHRTTMIKKRKLLEKIIYEALGLRKDGKLDDYEKKIIEGLAVEPDDKELNKLLADLYFTMSSYRKALPILKKIVEIDPNDHKAIRQIGEIYLTSGDFNIAEMLIQKAIAINPSNPKYYISMVELYYNTDRKYDAVSEMEKVIKLRPTNAAYMLTLADLYQELNDLDNAKKYYFRVLEFEPSNEKAKKKLKELVVE